MGPRSSPLLAVAILAGCGHPSEIAPDTPASTPAPTAADAAPEAPAETTEAALARAQQLLEAAGVRNAWSIHEDAADRAIRAGLTEVVAIGLLESLMADCLAAAAACESLHPLKRRRDDPGLQASQALVALLGELGTTRSFPLLLRLEARGLWEATRARARQLERLAVTARAEHPCRPPPADQIARARAGLDGFVVFERVGDELTTRAPTAVELDDLAYLLASVDGAGPAVGATTEAAGGPFARSGPADPQRTALYERFQAAKLSGDHAATAASARAFLGSLGYPGPIRPVAASEYAWGGAQYSYVMRDLAAVDEVLGDNEEALALLRRADPGGGACGTSVSSRWAEQVRGAIRSAERLGRCGDVVAERLLAVGGPEPDRYGTVVLGEAGFDVTRLYRGALVTLNRDAAPAELAAAIERGPAALQPAARARLERRGAEAWERRVFALEGLADVAQKEAIPGLLEALERGTTTVRVRAVAALARLAERPEYDPCVPGHGGGSGSSEWSREIRPLGRECETKLPAQDAAGLASRIVPLLGDRDPELRREAAAALGALGSPRSVAALRPLATDSYQPVGTQVCEEVDGEQQCRRPFPVREAARDTIARIRQLEARAAAAE